MTREELLELIFEDPEKVFAMFEGAGGGYEELNALEFPKILARERFPELTVMGHESAAETVFWISYWIEGFIDELIVALEVETGSREADVIEKLEGMTLGTKIPFLVDKNHVAETDPNIVMFKRVKELRNHAAHGRFDKLNYAGYSLSNAKGQIRLTVDIQRAMNKKNPLTSEGF